MLEQFALLDRTNTYNANMLQAIRVYRGEILRRQRLLAQRARRSGAPRVAELQSLRARIRSSVAAEKQRYRGLRAEVRRLLDARRQAEVAASRSAAARRRRCRRRRDRAGRGQRHRRRERGRRPPRDGTARPVVGRAPARSASRSASSACRTSRAAPRPSGFDCSGLVSWAYAQAGHPGLPHYTGALWNAGTRIASTSDLAPGDLVFFNSLDHVGMYIGGGQFVEAPHSGDVVKVSTSPSRSDYLGGVRISG